MQCSQYWWWKLFKTLCIDGFFKFITLMFKNILTLWNRVNSYTFFNVMFPCHSFFPTHYWIKLPACAFKAAFYFKYWAQLCAKGSKLLFFSVFISFKEKHCTPLNSYWFSKENHMVCVSPLLLSPFLHCEAVKSCVWFCSFFVAGVTP